jgi:hypothetical protein
MARSLPTLQLLALSVAVLGLTACGAGGYSNNNGSYNPIGNNGFGITCDPGTQVQLANPQPGQTGVPGNIGSITIVANGNANTLYNTFSSWNVILSDNFGNTVVGGQLNLVPFNNGPHPFPSDFYYSSSIQTLPSGRSWNAGLVQTFSNCAPYSLFGFST